VKLLIDTHVLLWFFQNDRELPIHIRELIEDEQSEVSVSIASYWEIGIKQARGKGEMPWTGSVPTLEHLALSQDIFTLPVTTDAVEQTKQLAPDHKDPFDRMIAASAITSGLRLVSCDAVMDLFVGDRLW